MPIYQLLVSSRLDNKIARLAGSSNYLSSGNFTRRRVGALGGKLRDQ
jgi:hypothetical protein